MAKFAEDDRIEQMNANKRRMKQLEHKRAVEKLIDDRKVQFAADRERELEERREEERMEAFRKQIIEEERQKLLREHAMRLLGYLPKVKLRAQRGSAGPWERGGGRRSLGKAEGGEGLPRGSCNFHDTEGWKGRVFI